MAYNIFNEAHGDHTIFPSGGGNQLCWKSNASMTWGMNLHLIRLTNVDPARHGGVQGCMECHGPNEWCQTRGGIGCCPDGSFCPVIKTGNASDAPKDYFYRYTVWYLPGDDPRAKQGAIMTLDISSNPACQHEFNVPSKELGFSQELQTFRPHFNMRVSRMRGHLHMGGYNVSLYRGGVPDPAKRVCVVHSTYGTEEGTPFNEKGFLVGVGGCEFQDPDAPFVLEKGELYTIEAIYNAGQKDPQLFASGHHDGVMAWAIVLGERCKTAGCAP